jgi:hypothetical protein
MPLELVKFDSSLRLELGAFYLKAQGGKDVTPITEWLKPCARFHEMMADALDYGNGRTE